VAETTDPLNRDQESSARNQRRSVEEIERDIHRTQREMGRTIDSIQYRLSPDYMKSRARERMKETTRGMMDRIRENPVATAVTGLGLYMLFRGGSSKSSAYESAFGEDYVMICDACGVPVDHHREKRHNFVERASDRASELGSEAQHRIADAAHNVSDRASEAVHSVSERASHAKESLQHSASRAGQRVRQTGRRVQQRFDKDPLLMGAIGIAAGALLGALIPESDKERELMGDARERVLKRAGRFAREKGEQVREVAEHVKDAAVEEAKSEARRQNLTGDESSEHREPPQRTPTV
jgi:gas vesicle protein